MGMIIPESAHSTFAPGTKTLRTMKQKLTLCCLSLMVMTGTGFAQNVLTGPSSSAAPYLLPAAPGVKVKSVLTVGDQAANGYKMVGIPDGTGAYDNGDGTFTVLINHELGQTAGIVRRHGNTGAFVSKWTLNKSTLSVVSGEDLIQMVHLWNPLTQSYQMYDSTSPMPVGFGRFCSADLAPVSAFYNAASGKGTQQRIFMNGEEIGAEGRGFGHIATGPNAGHTYELPRLGKFSWENSLANPGTGDVTVVAGTDDATPGQVYFYIGNKTNTGNEVERAGLTNGNLYSVSVQGLLMETSAGVPAPNTPFTMVNLGNVENLSGATLNNNSNNLGVTNFLRPEDGAWDPRDPSNFYFVTTNSFNAPSRLWKLHFNNINDLTQGGTITALLDGTEGPKMMDNVGFDNHGNLVIQEDPGNQTYLARMWNYNVDTDVLTEIMVHDSTNFQPGANSFLTQDEESSGVTDVSEILGNGWFIGVDQAHYGIPGELVEGGQFFVFLNPFTECAGLSDSISVAGTTTICPSESVTLTAGEASSYLWNNGDTTRAISVSQSGAYSVTVSGNSGCTVQSDTVNITVGGTPAQIVANGSTNICPKSSVQLSAGNQAPGTTYRWFRDGANAGSVPTINAKNAGTYALVTKLGACTDTAYQTVNILAAPAAVITNTGSDTICQGATTLLEASPAVSGFTYEWSRNLVSTGNVTTSQNADASGNYRVIVTDTNGCTATSAPYFIRVAPAPLASISIVGNNPVIPSGGFRVLRSTQNASLSFQWYFNGTAVTGAISNTYTAFVPGDYYVVVTRGNCSTTSATLSLTTSPLREAAGIAGEGTDGSVVVAAFPNPVNSTLNITVAGLDEVAGTIDIMDLNGRVVMQQSIAQPTATIDMSTVANGLYIVRFQDAAGHRALLKVSKQ